MRTAVFTLAFALFWLLAPATVHERECATPVATARALALTGTIDVAPFGDETTLPGTVVHAGRRRAVGQLGAALALVPAELVARALASVDREALGERLLLSATAAAAAALLCVVFFGTLRRRGLSDRAALGFTAALGLTTPILYFARVPEGTILATLLLYWALCEARAFVAAPRGGELGLGVTLGLLVVVDAQYALAVLVVLAWCGLHRHERFDRRTAAETLLPVAAGLAIALAHRIHVGAHAEPTGDLVQGLVGLLLSTGKSLFVYAPVLILVVPSLRSAWRRRRADAELTLVVFAAVVLAAARLDDWHGDPTWGPRRIVPLVPIALETIAVAWNDFAGQERRRHTLPLVALCAVGLGVQLVGVAVQPATYLDVLRRVRVESGAQSWFAVSPDEAHFMPQFSPVLGHAWLVRHMVTRTPRFDQDTPWALLLQRSPAMPDLLRLLRLDWIGRELPPPVVGAWLALLAVAMAVAGWRLRVKLPSRRDTVER